MADGAEGEEEAAPPPEPVPPLEDEQFEERREIFNVVYKAVHPDIAKLASLNERAAIPPEEDEDEAKKVERELRLKSLTYGEADMALLNQLLNLLKTGEQGALYPNKGAFLDLGSGAGKACMAAGMLHPFEKVIGVETLQSLNDFATKALADYQAIETLPEGMTRPEFQFIKGDFVADFEATMEPLAPSVAVCLAVANCYRDDQLQAMAKFATKMPDGSFFICLGQGLPESVTFGLNRNPLQRRAVNVKRCLAKRGCDPDSTPIEEPEVHEPVGWTELKCSPLDVEMAWGASKCFMYYKVPGPFTDGWEKGSGPWPQLVGLQKDEAMNKLAEARPDLQVELVEQEAPAPEDAVPERVRICFDPATDLVTEPAPQCG